MECFRWLLLLLVVVSGRYIYIRDTHNTLGGSFPWLWLLLLLWMVVSCRRRRRVTRRGCRWIGSIVLGMTVVVVVVVP